MGLLNFIKSLFSSSSNNEVISQAQTQSDIYRKQVENKRRIQKKKDEFSECLDSLPVHPIILSDEKIPKKKLADMPEIKYSNITKATNPNKIKDYIVVDIETTGLSVRNEIIELSAIKFENFSPVEIFTTLIKPKKEIPQEASDINHITDDMVVNSPRIQEVIPSFLEFIGESDVLVGHNLQFDLKFLHVWGIDFHTEKRRYYDTLSLSQRMLETSDYEKSIFGVENHKLTTLCEYYGIHRDDEHRSSSDCLATGILFVHLASERIPSEKFSNFSNIIIK